MEKVSVDAFGSTSQSLEELKRELGRLSSYTAELGATRDAATASQQAANRVLSLVGQLGELQQSQLAALKSDNDTALDLHRQALFQLTETWGERLSAESTKLLMTLDTIVGRQHQLAAELAEFQDAMRQASRFTEALESVRLQTVQSGEDVTRLAAGADAAFQGLETAITRQTAELHEALQQEAANQSVAFKQISVASERRDQQLRIEWEGLLAKFSELLMITKDSGERTAQQGKQFEGLLTDNFKMQVVALKQLTIGSDQKYEAQCSAQAEALLLMKTTRKESRIWNALTLLLVFGVFVAILLLRPK